MFIFYDTETTGTNISYDQILQFAAILTDDRLHEIDRFEIRCQLLPWVVPSPSALLVSGTRVDQLTDPKLPTFFAMMASIRERLSGWGPATFIGYNSMRFDEPLLQRAFWQALLPPYATVTNGNARLDLLPIIRAIVHFRPETLLLPMREDGGISFRLDQLSPLNGFDAHQAHDAMGDAEATIFIARLLSERTADLWKLLSLRAAKAKVASILSFGSPVLAFQYVGGQPRAWFGQRIDRDYSRASHATLAMLGYDWRTSKDGFSDFELSNASGMRQALRRVALNKAPVIFTVEEAGSLGGMTLATNERLQSRFLAADEDYCAQLVDKLGAAPDYKPVIGELEETIFDGFPLKQDESLMKAFHDAPWPRRLEIARNFDDRRFRRLAMRIVYLSAAHLVSIDEREQMRSGITRRLAADSDDPHTWRSIPDALMELRQIPPEHLRREEILEIETWLIQRSGTTIF